MSYTLYRIAMTLDIMVFIVLATIVYGFFPLTPVMIIMLALLDDIPIMTIAFDQADVPQRPVRWDMSRVLIISSLLGGIAVVQSFGLLYIGQTVIKLDAAHLQTFLFLQLVVGGHLMLFVTRTKGAAWRQPNRRHPSSERSSRHRSSPPCSVAFGLLVPALSWDLIALVWIYNLAWMIVQDVAKRAAYRELEQRANRTTVFLSRLKMPLYGRAAPGGAEVASGGGKHGLS